MGGEGEASDFPERKKVLEPFQIHGAPSRVRFDQSPISRVSAERQTGAGRRPVISDAQKQPGTVARDEPMYRTVPGWSGRLAQGYCGHFLSMTFWAKLASMKFATASWLGGFWIFP
jgi:hypothetical protein